MKSKLPEGWGREKLSDITKRVKVGFVGSCSKYYCNNEIGIPMIRTTNLSKSGVILKDVRYITEEFYEKNKKSQLKRNDILIARHGSNGLASLWDKNIKAQCLNVIVVETNDNLCNPVYLTYAINSKIVNDQILSMVGGSVQGVVNTKSVAEVMIPYPILNEQKVIADTLSALDDKIELNNKINQNLEQQAQAIFKHWFIDFEFPDENGNPYKSSGGEMIESELGMIPKGWEIGTVDDLGNVVGGSTPSRKKSEYFTTNGIPWITPKDLSNNKNIFIDKGEEDITEEGFNSTSIKILPRGTVLFSSRAPIGYIGIAKNDVTTNQGFKSIIPCKVKGVDIGYIFNWLKENVGGIESRASGSTFKEISGGELKKIEAIIPDKKLLNKFEELQNDYFNKIESNEDQNRVLDKLRNTLLPKLMSGEIRIPLD